MNKLAMQKSGRQHGQVGQRSCLEAKRIRIIHHQVISHRLKLLRSDFFFLHFYIRDRALRRSPVSGKIRPRTFNMTAWFVRISSFLFTLYSWPRIASLAGFG